MKGCHVAGLTTERNRKMCRENREHGEVQGTVSKERLRTEKVRFTKVNRI